MRNRVTLFFICLSWLSSVPLAHAAETAKPAMCNVDAVDKRMNAQKQKATERELKYKARFDAKLEELGRLNGWTNAEIGQQSTTYFTTPEHKKLHDQKKPLSRKIYGIFEVRGMNTTMECAKGEELLATFREMAKLDEKQWKLAIKNIDADLAKAKKKQK